MSESIASQVLGGYSGSIRLATPSKAPSAPAESFNALSDNEFGEPEIANHLKLGVLFSDQDFGQAGDRSQVVEARDRLIEIDKWIEMKAKEHDNDYKTTVKDLEKEANTSNSMTSLQRLDRIYALIRLSQAKEEVTFFKKFLKK